MPYAPQAAPIAAELPAVDGATIDRALALAEGQTWTNHVRGQWDRWMQVALDKRHSLHFDVRAVGIRVAEVRARLVTAGNRITDKPEIVATHVLTHGSMPWRRAVALLEGSPALAPAIDTRGT
jgi:2-methylcitrate dehydratase PrpD